MFPREWGVIQYNSVKGHRTPKRTARGCVGGTETTSCAAIPPPDSHSKSEDRQGTSPYQKDETTIEQEAALSLMINNVSGIVNRALAQLRDLEEEHGHLYSRFTKIAGRKLNRLYWYGLGRLPSEPTIRE